MSDHPERLSDKRLNVATIISCKREPSCFAFLCSNAIAAPMAIERLNFDISSADYFQGRASVWATLDMHAEGGEGIMSLLGFDESFLRPFTRALIESATTRHPHRVSISTDPSRAQSPRVVEYVRNGGGVRVRELILTPHENVMSIGFPEGSAEETLFQVPRTDSFLRALARMTQVADAALKDTLDQMERLSGLCAADQAGPGAL